MTPTRAVIFDMDGVIVDSESRHERAFYEVLREIGYGEGHGMRFSDYIGRSDQELWVDFVALNRPPHGLRELMAMKQARTMEMLRRDQPLFAGLPELVEKLAARYPLGVASGSERCVIDAVLELQGLGRHFSAVVSASEVPRGKPAPDIFLRAANLLGVPVSSCWVVEDSKPGVAAGLAAGMKVIAITNTHPADDLVSATHVVSSYGEIERILLDENNLVSSPPPADD